MICHMHAWFTNIVITQMKQNTQRSGCIFTSQLRQRGEALLVVHRHHGTEQLKYVADTVEELNSPLAAAVCGLI